MLTLGFDTRFHFAAVSDFVEAGSVENGNFRYVHPRHPYKSQRSKCLTLESRPRSMCVKSLPEIACDGLEEVAGKCEKEKKKR